MYDNVDDYVFVLSNLLKSVIFVSVWMNQLTRDALDFGSEMLNLGALNYIKL